MPTELTKEQFIEILQDNDITKPEDLAVFQTIYSFDEHKAYASQVGRISGKKTKSPASPIDQLPYGAFDLLLLTQPHATFFHFIHLIIKATQFKFTDK